MVKKKEIEQDAEIKMCRWYAYNLDCPDLVEFKGCRYQHDEQIRYMHEMGM